jgi:hypothetical protein
MPNHVAPAELAPTFKMSEEELLSFCFAESIPVLHGRVDRTLVEAQIAANQARDLAQQSSATA